MLPEKKLITIMAETFESENFKINVFQSLAEINYTTQLALLQPKTQTDSAQELLCLVSEYMQLPMDKSDQVLDLLTRLSALAMKAAIDICTWQPDHDL